MPKLNHTNESVSPSMHLPKEQNIFQKAANLKQLVELESKARKLCTIPTSDFIVLQKIGVGGDAEVYEGVYLDKKIAIKKFNVGSKLGGLPVLRSFVREAELLGLFHHKNIITCFGAACEAPDVYYLLLELIPGGTLEQLLHKKKVKFKDASKVLQFALDIASGMRQVHQRNIIHRDLKPANLMVEASGSLKIVDFSTGRVKDESGHMTGEAGSFRWTAPEVLKGERYTDSADVYSFAVVMWEIMTGELPFSKQPPMSAALSIVRGNRPGRISAAANCPEALAALLNRCWHEKPSHRPRFDEIVPVLESCVASLPPPISAQPCPESHPHRDSGEQWPRMSWCRLPFNSAHGSPTRPSPLVASPELNPAALSLHHLPTTIHMLPLPLDQPNGCSCRTSDPSRPSRVPVLPAKPHGPPLSHTSSAASASCPSLSTMTIPPTRGRPYAPCLSPCPSPAPHIDAPATACSPLPQGRVSPAQSLTASSSSHTSRNLSSDDGPPSPLPSNSSSPQPRVSTPAHAPLPAFPIALPPPSAAATAVGGGGGGGGEDGGSVRGAATSKCLGCGVLLCFAPLAHLPAWSIPRAMFGLARAPSQTKLPHHHPHPQHCASSTSTPPQ